MKWKFEIGKPVVCTTKSWNYCPGRQYRKITHPEYGRVYTVIDIVSGTLRGVECTTGLWLAILGWTDEHGQHHYFSSDGFRPCKPTNIDPIKLLLDITPEETLQIKHFDHILEQIMDDGVKVEPVRGPV